MPRILPAAAGAAAIAALISGPVLYALHTVEDMRNFRAVREGVLYRSGQMTVTGLKRAVHDHGIKTVVSLRDGRTRADRAEEAFCNKEEIRFFRLPPLSWEGEQSHAPVAENVRQFVAIINDPKNYPILVHCFGGVHRAGAYTAIYRMEREHWSNAEAIAEVKATGYDTLDWEFDVLGYLERYRPGQEQGEGQ